MKKLFGLIALVMSAMCVNAQTDKSDWTAPYWFVGVQGGAATTLQKGFDAMDMIVPTASVQFGRMFSPEVGLRLHGNGMWQKAGMHAYGVTDPYKTKYADGNADVLLNLSTLFGKKDYYPVNLYTVAGLGYRHQWDDTDAKNSEYGYFGDGNTGTPTSHNSMNERLGLMLEANIAKHWSVNAEVDYNHWGTKFDRIAHDQITAQVGLTYKFGFKKAKKVEEPVPEPVPAPAPEPKPVVKPEPAPEPAPAPVEKKLESMEKDVFYVINQATARGNEATKIEEAAEWLKNHPTADCTVTGYADKGTGTAAVNKRIAKRRADNAAAKLQSLGVAADRITVDSKGDTVQPFPKNNDNRVVIIVAKEK